MISSLIKFLSEMFSFIFSKTVPKFFLFFSLYFVVLEFTPILITLLGGESLINRISGLFSSIPSGALYFLSIFRLDDGLKIILSAYVVRFIIRRIPIIG